jgi:hypothetical protein
VQQPAAEMAEALPPTTPLSARKPEEGFRPETGSEPSSTKQERLYEAQGSPLSGLPKRTPPNKRPLQDLLQKPKQASSGHPSARSRADRPPCGRPAENPNTWPKPEKE